jgi:hypothetical protein
MFMKHSRHKLLTIPISYSQYATLMGSPNRHCPLRGKAPDYDPAVRVAGGEICVLVEEVEGVDWRSVTSEDVCWHGGGVCAL